MREHLVRIALNEVGYTEESGNRTKYGEWFGYDGHEWCGMFVSYCFDKAGINLGKIDFFKGFAGCQYATRNIKKWGKQVTKPMPGDVVFFDWQGDGKFDHTGIFVKDSRGGFFQSVEGNTAYGNDSHGGQVMLRERTYRTAIFVRPNVLIPYDKKAASEAV